MEFAHRYVLGVYDLFERIVKANPNVFFEGCSGGGARFDGGVLAYFPQIWTSDDSDAEERTKIQYGTSIVYPLSAMSAHVSAVPNHQTGRITPMATRADIAHLAATGYELDTTVFTDEDREVVKAQVEEYKSIEELILAGDLYRIDSPFEGNYFTQTVVSKDKSHAILTVYRRLVIPNTEHHRIYLAGLDKDKTYYIEGLDITAKGSTLMNVGIIISYKSGDFYSETYKVTEVK
jgi:alpha-galactosidase